MLHYPNAIITVGKCRYNLPQLPTLPQSKRSLGSWGGSREEWGGPQITYLFKLDFPSPVTGKSPEEATNVVLTSSCPDSSVPVWATSIHYITNRFQAHQLFNFQFTHDSSLSRICCWVNIRDRAWHVMCDEADIVTSVMMVTATRVSSWAVSYLRILSDGSESKTICEAIHQRWAR